MMEATKLKSMHDLTDKEYEQTGLERRYAKRRQVCFTGHSADGRENNQTGEPKFLGNCKTGFRV